MTSVTSVASEHEPESEGPEESGALLEAEPLPGSKPLFKPQAGGRSESDSSELLLVTENLGTPVPQLSAARRRIGRDPCMLSVGNTVEAWRVEGGVGGSGGRCVVVARQVREEERCNEEDLIWGGALVPWRLTPVRAAAAGWS